MRPTLLLLLLVPLTLQGCVAWEIRDEMRKANAELTDVKARLDTTNNRLDQVEVGLHRLDRTNTLIDDVQQGLGRIDTTNSSLSTLERQLALLDSINKSMSHLDAHLASLRKTISKLDGVIPFLDLGGSDPIPEPSKADLADAAAAPAPAADPAKPTDPAKRETLAGAWIAKYPTSSAALVLLPDHTFIASGSGEPADAFKPAQPPQPRRTGTWARTTKPGEPDALTLSLAPVTTTNPDGTKSTTTPAVTYRIVNQTARALTLDSGPTLLILSRP